MTREEARDLLMNISAYDVDMDNIGKQEAMDMAIKALEKPDVVEVLQEIRDEIENVRNDMPEENNYCTGRIDGMLEARNMIDRKIKELTE